MIKTRPLMTIACLATLCGFTAFAIAELAATATPKVGDAAPDFSLSTIDDQMVSLSNTLKDGPAVVVVLRGWPGYQCPICTSQFVDLRKHAADFAAAGGRVILIYPGPGEKLKEHAKAFVTDKAMPTGFTFVLDPDYVFTNAWNLRWDAPQETAYPSSFVIGKDGVVKFAKVSKEHGGRAKADELLEALKHAS